MFVFFHVGDDTTMPELLVASIKFTNPDTPIVMCTDNSTPVVTGVTEVARQPCDTDRLMTSRINAFAALQLEGAAVYLDTDMLVTSRFDVAKALGNKEVCLCRRRFMRDASFNFNFHGLNFSEHSGKTLDQVFPILACFTVSRSYRFWQELGDLLRGLPEKYSIWYGDQQAMKDWLRGQTQASVGLMDEAQVALLPDQSDGTQNPIAYHFKGANRKALMKPYAKRLGFIP